jgi:peptidoglycan/xylan/chitin deacetylase (PgdA/CDA1 family)
MAMQSIWFIALIASLVAGCVTAPGVDDHPAQITTQRVEFMLSFDDGPLPDMTERVLDMLATLNTVDGTPVKAGFFLLSDATEGFWQRRVTYAPYELWTKGSIAKYPEIARRIKQAGHTIGNHTAHHPWYRWPWMDTPGAVQAEFAMWEATSTRVLGASSTRLFRPPYLILTKNVRETANRLGYQLVMGELVGDTTPNVTLDEIMKGTESILQAWSKPYPCVLIFHDNRPTTYEHLTEIVESLQQQGFALIDFAPERL